MNEIDSVELECEICGAPYIPASDEDDEYVNVIQLNSLCDCDEIKSMWSFENKTDKPYINHCWNCPAKIDSRVCRRDPEPTNGYICKRCGESLKNFKKRQN